MSVSTLVSKSWLQANIRPGKLSLLDCSWYMPSLNHPVKKEFEQNRLKGARFFDIDEIADKTVTLPHMLPIPAEFQLKVRELGIKEDDHVICYDTNGQYMASARAWWMFRLFGHEKVSVLHGGFVPTEFPEAEREWGPVGETQRGDFTVKSAKKLVVSLDEVLKNLETKEYQVVDARSSDRFLARVPEPRAGLVGGHMPGAFNVPFGTVLNGRSIVNEQEVRDVFQRAGVDLTKPIITSCGSGVTAAVLSLALHSIGVDSLVYDGSWSEYGQESLGLPVETEALK